MAKKKMLIVEDEVDILDIVKTRFTANNYDVVTAPDGETALAIIQKEKPDAVLLDIRMPGMDGLTVLKKIRENDKNIPVFIYTAYSNEERVKMASQFNATGFIVKTNDLQAEIDKITATLQIADKYKKRPT